MNLDSIIHSDRWRGYHGLVDVGYDKHFRVHHGVNEFVRGNSHINGIESFWSYAKIRLVKFHGMDKKPSICILKSVSLGSIIEVKICINYYLKSSVMSL